MASDQGQSVSGSHGRSTSGPTAAATKNKTHWICKIHRAASATAPWPRAASRQVNPRRSDQQGHAGQTRDVIIRLGDRPEAEDPQVAHRPPPGKPERRRSAPMSRSTSPGSIPSGVHGLREKRQEHRDHGDERPGKHHAGPLLRPAANAGDAQGCATDRSSPTSPATRLAGHSGSSSRTATGQLRANPAKSTRPAAVDQPAQAPGQVGGRRQGTGRPSRPPATG